MMTQSPAACNTRALRYPVCVWSIDQIADFMAESVMAENLRLRAEDAVAGVDALDETALHPVIASYFSRCGLGVLREHHFPTPKRARPRNSERERCDLVLTHDPAGVLIDPVEVDRREHELALASTLGRDERRLPSARLGHTLRFAPGTFFAVYTCLRRMWRPSRASV